MNVKGYDPKTQTSTMSAHGKKGDTFHYREDHCFSHKIQLLKKQERDKIGTCLTFGK